MSDKLLVKRRIKVESKRLVSKARNRFLAKMLCDKPQ